MSATENDLAKWTELADTLDGIIAATISLTEGCRHVFELRHALKQEDNKLFNPFAAFYSEADSFPLGSVRELWAAPALAQMDAKRELIDEQQREWIVSASLTLRELAMNQLAR